MGGIFGVTSRRNCILDVFFGTDYHSHLGTRRAGMAAYDPELGLQREIHNIENSPFRTKFEHVGSEMSGNAAIGCISDTDPQPLLIHSNLGLYAISTIGVIHNGPELMKQYLSFSGGHFDVMTGGRVNANELTAAMIDQKSNFADGIRFAQNVIEGTATILILKEGGHLIAARDRFGRLSDGSLVLADEISPDTCRFWDATTGEKLDKDRFRRDLGGIEDAYNEMMRRVFGA